MHWSRTLSIFAAFLALYVATAGGHLYSPDEEVMFRVTQSLATRASLDIDPMRDGAGGTFASAPGRGGRQYAQYGIANSLVAVPFYALGAAASYVIPDPVAARLLDFKTTLYAPESGAGRGHELLKRFFVSFVGIVVGAALAALVGWLGGWAAHRCLQHPDAQFTAPDRAARYETRIAWAVAAAYGAGTMAWPHARTFFSEPPATFFVLLAFAIAVTGPFAGPRRAAWAGAACAAALLARLDSVVALPGVALLVLLRHLEACHGSLAGAARLPASSLLRSLRQRRFPVTVAAFVGPIAAFGVLMLGLNWYHFGSPVATAYSNQPEGIHFSTPLLAGLYGFLFSAGKSVFLFSPAILLALFGWKVFAHRVPALALALATSILFVILFHAQWQNWAGGWCWGPRHFFMIHALLMPAVAGFLVPITRARKAVYACVMVVAVGVQVFGCSQNFIDFYILYYRTPDTQPNATAMYGPEDAMAGVARCEIPGANGKTRTVGLNALVAPINDSIYVPQNTPWYRYSEMQRMGFTDNLWLRLFFRAQGEEQAVR